MPTEQQHTLLSNPVNLGDGAYRLVEIEKTNQELVEQFVADELKYQNTSRNFLDTQDIVYFPQQNEEVQAATSSSRGLKSREDFQVEGHSQEQVTQVYEAYKASEVKAFEATIYYHQMQLLFGYLKTVLIPEYIKNKQEVDDLATLADDFMRKLPMVEWNNALSYQDIDDLKHDMEAITSFLAKIKTNKRQFYKSSLIRLIKNLNYCATGVISKQKTLRNDLYLGDGVLSLLQSMRDDVVLAICLEYCKIKQINDELQEHLKPVLIGESRDVRQGRGLGLEDVEKNKLLAYADPHRNYLKLNEEMQLLDNKPIHEWLESQFHYRYNFFTVVESVLTHYQEKYKNIIQNNLLNDVEKNNQITALFQFLSHFNITINTSEFYDEIDDEEDEYATICIYKQNILPIIQKPLIDFLSAESIICDNYEVSLAVGFDDSGLKITIESQQMNLKIQGKTHLESSFKKHHLSPLQADCENSCQLLLPIENSYIVFMLIIANRTYYAITDEQLLSYLILFKQQNFLNNEQYTVLNDLIITNTAPEGRCLLYSEQQVELFLEQSIDLAKSLTEYPQKRAQVFQKLSGLGCKVINQEQLVKSSNNKALILKVNGFYADKVISADHHQLFIEFIQKSFDNDSFTQLIHAQNFDEVESLIKKVNTVLAKFVNLKIEIQAKGCKLDDNGIVTHHPVINTLMAYYQSFPIAYATTFENKNTKKKLSKLIELNAVKSLVCTDLIVGVELPYLTVKIQANNELTTLCALNVIEKTLAHFSLFYERKEQCFDGLRISKYQCYQFFLILMSVKEQFLLSSTSVAEAAAFCHHQRLVSDEQYQWLSHLLMHEINPLNKSLYENVEQGAEFIDKALNIETAIGRFARDEDYGSEPLKQRDVNSIIKET